MENNASREKGVIMILNQEVNKKNEACKMEPSGKQNIQSQIIWMLCTFCSEKVFFIHLHRPLGSSKESYEKRRNQNCARSKEKMKCLGFPNTHYHITS